MPDEYDDLDELDETQDVDQDPLGDLDDDLKARVEQLAEERAQEQITQFKGNYGRRFNVARGDLNGMGLDVAEDGKIVIRDPKKAASALGITQAEAREQMQAQDEDDDEDPPDPAYDPAGFKAWSRKQAQKANRELAEEVKALRQQLGQTQFDHTFPSAQSEAKTYLEAKGFGDLTQAEDFDEHLARALQGVPADQRTPAMIRSAAMMIVPHLEAALEEEGPVKPTRRPSVDGRSAATTAARAGLNQIGGSRNTGRPTTTSEDEALAREYTGLFGETVTPAEARALRDDPTGQKYQALRQQRLNRGRR